MFWRVIKLERSINPQQLGPKKTWNLKTAPHGTSIGGHLNCRGLSPPSVALSWCHVASIQGDMWFLTFPDPEASFRVVLGSSDRNDLSQNSILSKIFYLDDKSCYFPSYWFSFFAIGEIRWQEFMACWGRRGCRGMEVLTEQRPAANSQPTPP